MSRLATPSYICALEISSNLISVVQWANFPVSDQNQEINFSFSILKVQSWINTAPGKRSRCFASDFSLEIHNAKPLLDSQGME